MKKPLLFILLFITMSNYAQNIVLDTDYGTNGFTTINSQTPDDGVKSVLLSDGSLLISALKYNETTSEHEQVVVKYKINGEVDDSFGENGIYTSYIKDDNGVELLIDGNENVYLAGEDYEADRNVVVKLLPTGVIDTDFGNNGEVVIDDSYINIRYYLKGDFLYIGVNYGSSSNQYGIKRLNLDGEEDMSFGQEGIVNVDNYINEFYVSNDNNFIIVGSDEDYNVIVSVHNNNGELLTNFGDDGVLFKGDESAEYFKFFESETNLYMTVGVVGDTIYSEIHKFNAGSLDAAFGNLGIITISDFYITNLYVLGLSLDSDFINLKINSYNTNGLINTSFAENGVFIEETDFNQFAVNLHIREDSFVIVGENNYTEDNIEHFSLKYDLTNATASLNDHEVPTITYPNPIGDIFTVNSLSEDISNLKLFSVEGKLLKQSISNTIDTSDLASNLYILNCHFENGKILSKKIIKQ